MMFRTTAAAFALAFAASSAVAAWPERPIKVYIGYAPGGSTDVVARMIAPKLSEKLGQPVIIETSRAARATSPAELMLQAPADGYTLMMTTVGGARHQPGPLQDAEIPSAERLHRRSRWCARTR
jgi:tripartite-type tricarboxylate transporter receptor subunit TctC